MSNNTSPKYQILVVSMDIEQDANNYMQKFNKIMQPSPEILVICYFKELLTCWTLPT